MRSALLFVILMLAAAGCADPDANGSTPVTPTATSPAPTPPSPGGPFYEETQGAWTLRVEPAQLAGRIGDALAFRATITHEGTPPEGATASLDAWGRFDIERPAITTATTVLTGVVHLGQDATLRMTIHAADASAQFDGPPVALNATATRVMTQRLTDVSSDAPGLSVVTEPSLVRATFAAEKNATTTGDESVRAVDDFFLIEGEPRRLVGFVERAYNDAVSGLPEPQRTRVVAEIDTIAPGEVEVVVVSRVVCFCFPPPGAERVGQTVTVP